MSTSLFLALFSLPLVPSQPATPAPNSAVLHAAALDGRIGRVTIENSLASYRQIIDQPAARNVSEVVIPGVLRKYDTGELLEALYPRPVTIVSPRDALGDPMGEANFRKGLAYVFESDRRLGLPNRIRLLTGGDRVHLFE